MPIIIISSDSYKTGREISEKTAKAIGYDYIDREILGPVAEKSDVQEEELIKALDEAPSFLGLSSKLRNRYLAYIQEATLGQLLEDNVVCHGLAAHLFVLGVSHVLKVRVLSDPEELASQLSSEAGGSAEKMKKLLKREDAQRKRWSIETFNLDETDPSNYDVVINLSQIDPDEAVKTIADMTAYRKFQPMTYSSKCLKDKELASRVRLVLMERFSDVRVQADGSTIVVETKAIKREKQKRTEAIKELAEGVEGVGYVEVHMTNDIFRQAAESSR
ncbi:MAG: cytidylate kinase-like family protein [Desulfobacteraceae bacterium]|nr:cytidylate kinase-like family protein [Desulfobacteraceae bacterium]